MKILKSCIIASLLVATMTFNNINVYATETVSVQNESITMSNNSLQSCADNIKKIYTARYPEHSYMISDIVDTISSSDEFMRCFENEGVVAFCIIEDSLRDALEPAISTCSLSNGIYSSKNSVPVIKQSEDWYCGPASVLQALIGNGVLENNSSNKSATKQKEVADALYTDEDGTYITNISAYMRQKFSAKNGYEYKAKAFTCYTYEKAIELVKKSLQRNAVPIIRVDDTSVLNYYNRNSYSHYMCISKVNTNNNTVTLVDPHYDPAYRGAHVISISEFEELVNYNGWIALYTSAADGYYVYS